MQSEMLRVYPGFAIRCDDFQIIELVQLARDLQV